MNQGTNGYGNQNVGFNALPVSQSVSAPQINAPSVLYAPTHKDFDNVAVQPGRQAIIIAQNEPYLAFKSADDMGMVQTKLYRIEPITAEQVDPVKNDYITREEFNAFIASLTSDNTNEKETK